MRGTTARACSGDVLEVDGEAEVEANSSNMVVSSASSSGGGEQPPELAELRSEADNVELVLRLRISTKHHVHKVRNRNLRRQEEEAGRDHLGFVGILHEWRWQQVTVVRNQGGYRVVGAPVGEGFGRA